MPAGWLCLIQRRLVYAGRRYFFEAIHRACASAPGRPDASLSQRELLEGMGRITGEIDAEMGTLLMHIEASYFGQRFEFAYSILQAGETLRIGVLLGESLQQAPLVDSHMELRELWPGAEPLPLPRGESVLYDWSFETPGLYRRWLVQERFVLGMRHFHVRILRIVRDFALVIAQVEGAGTSAGTPWDIEDEAWDSEAENWDTSEVAGAQTRAGEANSIEPLAPIEPFEAFEPPEPPRPAGEPGSAGRTH
jgi:hypothetical protein